MQMRDRVYTREMKEDQAFLSLARLLLLVRVLPVGGEGALDLVALQCGNLAGHFTFHVGLVKVRWGILDEPLEVRLGHGADKVARSEDKLVVQEVLGHVTHVS